MLIDQIIKKRKKNAVLTDTSYSTHILYQRFEANLVEALNLSQHGKELIKLGLEEDLHYCAQVNITDIVPIYKNGVIGASS
jgi:2-phosphosulfolactate phosphatase